MLQLALSAYLLARVVRHLGNLRMQWQHLVHELLRVGCSGPALAGLRMHAPSRLQRPAVWPSALVMQLDVLQLALSAYLLARVVRYLGNLRMQRGHLVQSGMSRQIISMLP